MNLAIDNLIELMNKDDELLHKLVKATSLEANALRKTAYFSRRLAANTEETLEVMEQLQRVRQTLDNEVKSQPQPEDAEDEDSLQAEKLRDLDHQITQRILKLKNELELRREESNKIKARLDEFYAMAVESKLHMDQLQEEIVSVDSRIKDAERAIGGKTGVVIVGSVNKLVVLGKLQERQIWKGMVELARDGVSPEMIDTLKAVAEDLGIGIVNDPAKVPETFRSDPVATDLYFFLEKKSRGESRD